MSVPRITDSLTALILTKNEAPNIGRCLERLRWVPRVLVVDSFSTDDTPAMARSFPNTEVLQREFDDHARQWSYGLDQAATDWVLALDADYMLTDELIGEIREMQDNGPVQAFEVAFTYCVYGRPLRGTLYTPAKVLFRKDAAFYVQEGHTQRLRVGGPVGSLKGKILHDDRKSLARWYKNQISYASLEADYLLAAGRDRRAISDRMRSCLLMPLVVPFYCLVAQRGLLDGRAGLFYAMQRTLAELLIALHLLDRRMRSRPE